jgi:hypothetical protein
VVVPSVKFRVRGYETSEMCRIGHFLLRKKDPGCLPFSTLFSGSAGNVIVLSQFLGNFGPLLGP